MRVLATYGPAVDSGSSAEAARLWLDTGIYDGGESFRAEGHAAIAALYDSSGHQQLINTGSGHLTMLPWISVSGDTARAVAHSMVCLRTDDGYQVWRAAANEWRFVRTKDGWRIVERINRPLNGTAASHDVLRRAVSP